MVYPGGSGPLSNRQHTDYERDGFLFLPSLLSTEEVRAALGDVLGRGAGNPQVDGDAVPITDAVAASVELMARVLVPLGMDVGQPAALLGPRLDGLDQLEAREARLNV